MEIKYQNPISPPTPYTHKDKGKTHLKIKQNNSLSAHQRLWETTDLNNQVGFQLPDI